MRKIQLPRALEEGNVRCALKQASVLHKHPLLFLEQKVKPPFLLSTHKFVMEPAALGSSSETSSGTERQAALQVVGLADLKSALKSAFDEALAQFKEEQRSVPQPPWEVSIHSRPSVNEVTPGAESPVTNFCCILEYLRSGVSQACYCHAPKTLG